jgi:molybdenum cofactor guanylyltransferase
MGRDKALLPHPAGGTMIQAVARAVAEACGGVTAVGHPQIASIPDLYPGQGPLGGVLTALRHTFTGWNLIVACDMPALTGAFLKTLIGRARASSAHVILPRGPDNLPQPLCALYHRAALPHLERSYAAGERSLVKAIRGLPTEPFAVADLDYFQNVNTPEDWLTDAS